MQPKTTEWKSDRNEWVVLPTRGRMLQVRIDGVPAFWENPDWSGDWNVGGDRIWVGPEIAWHWKKTDTVDFAQYDVPETNDSENWTVEEQADGRCRVRKEAEMRHQREDKSVRYEIVREFEQVALSALDEFESAAAFQTVNRLTLLGGTPGHPLDMWGLLQLPAGGVLYIPVRQKSEFRDYFTPIPDDMWSDKDGVLELQITGRQQYKVGLSAARVSGQMAYARAVEGGFLVVYRTLSPEFWRPYCDVPICDQQGQGDAIQVYNDGAGLGSFGEMEYHTPAIFVGEGEQTVEDRCLTVVGLVNEERWPAWRARWLGACEIEPGVGRGESR